MVFADSQGLALTAVHVFNEFEEDLLSELQFHMNEIEGATARPHLGERKGDRRAKKQLELKQYISCILTQNKIKIFKDRTL